MSSTKYVDIDRTLANLEDAIHPDKVAAIKEFVNHAATGGISAVQQERQIQAFKTILTRFVPDGFRLRGATEDELKDILAQVNRSDYAAATKHKFKGAIKKFYRVENGGTHPDKYGLLTGGPGRAAELLDAIWDDVATDSVYAQLTNTWFEWYTRLETSWVPVPQVSPYNVPGTPVQRWFRRLVERHIAFEEFEALVTDTSPTVTIATVNVNSGAFERYSDTDITSERLVASAAVPHLFDPVELDGDWYWDGLLSQNPPVRQFLTDDGPKPDELWVIQINPQSRDDRPTSLGEIADRRNELAGNLSLTQELHFIEAVNDWVEAGHLPEDYKQVEVRCLTLDRELDYASKFERDPDFIRDLREYGEAQADRFLAGALDDACPAMLEDADPG